MNKRIVKKVGAWLLLLVVALSTIHADALTAEAVTPSEKEYGLEILEAHSLFMHNKQPIDGEIGTELYMTYTVKAKTSAGGQMGIIGAQDAERKYPYKDGGLMRYNADGADMLEPGATYFIKCTVASGGFHYDITKAKGNEAEHIYFDRYTGGTVEDKMNYFGLWIAPASSQVVKTSAELTDIRCYDSKGNDLGIEVETKSGGSYMLSGGEALAKDKSLDFWYEIDVQDQKFVAVSNKIPTDSNKIFIEYTVESANFTLNQEGVAFSNKPQNGWPHSTGCLKYMGYTESTDSPLMLLPGAQYVIVIERTESEFNVMVYRTLNSETVYFEISKMSKTYDPVYQFVSLWFAEDGTNNVGSFKLTNFKMYDADKNNLGVQCNKTATIFRKGAPENYADCEGVYYCKENQKSFGLYKNKNIKFTDENGTTDGTYRISSDVMSVAFPDGTSAKYDYLYEKITDSVGNEYTRLKTYQINFVTGSGTKIETQNFSTKEGYIAKQPEDPVLENCTFEGWYKGDGTEYDFSQLVTESSTLYAKWSGDSGITFLASDNVEENTTKDLTVIFASAGGVLLLVGLAACFLLIRKGTKVRNDRK